MKFRKKSLTALLMAACMIMTTPVMPVAAETDDSPESKTADAQVDSTDAAEESGKADKNAEPESEDENVKLQSDADKQTQVTDRQVKNTDTEDEETDGTGTGVETGDVTEPDDGGTDEGIPEGAGTGLDPYQIGTVEELLWFAGLVNGTLEDGTVQNTYACAELTNNIVFNDYPNAQDVLLWEPIGTSEHSYEGLFDGKGNTISGIVCKENDVAGVFGCLGEAAEIINLGIVDSVFYSENIAGAIAGCTGNGSSNIQDCWNDASEVYGKAVSGGIVATLGKEAAVSGCYNTGTVGGEECKISGGIVGANNNGMLTCSSCYNTGMVTACGGEMSESSGAVSSAGGVIGYNNGLQTLIISCYNYGEVSIKDDSSQTAGAIVGYIEDGSLKAVYNCFYLTGTCNNGIGYEGECIQFGTSEKEELGISMELNDAPEEKNEEEFSSGEVAWLLNSDIDMWYQNLTGNSRDIYPVLEDTHKKVYTETTQKCEWAPKVIVGYNNEKFDNKVLGAHDWHEAVPCSGCGIYKSRDVEIPRTDEGVYMIDSADDLYWLSAKVNGTHGLDQDSYVDAVLTADITVNENVLTEERELAEDADSFRVWEPIGFETISQDRNNEYRGTFDGNGHTISGLYLPENVVAEKLGYEGEMKVQYLTGGLFGELSEDSSARVRNVKVTDSYFSSTEKMSSYGGIAGMIMPVRPKSIVEEDPYYKENSILVGCEFDGVVRANYAGGIVGLAQDGKIYGCKNNGDIYALGEETETEEAPAASAGGICGVVLQEGTQIFLSGNTGNIYSDGNAGGIVGTLRECFWTMEIISSYNAGSVYGACSAGGIAGDVTEQVIAGASYSIGTVESGDKNKEGGIVGLVREDGVFPSFYNGDIYPGGPFGADSIGDNIENLEESGYLKVSQKHFESGAVGAFMNELLVQQGFTDAEIFWYQTLGQEMYPVHDSTHGEIIIVNEDVHGWDDIQCINPSDLVFAVTVTSKINGIAEGTVATVSGGGIYTPGEEVTVSAPEVQGFRFLGWYKALDNETGYTGKVLSTNLSYRFKVIGQTNLVAVYESKRDGGTAVLRVEGSGFTVNNNEVCNETGYEAEFQPGETITLEYVGAKEFLYWKNESGKILNRDKIYRFTFLGDTTVIPVYVDKELPGDAFVEFVSYYDQVIMAETYSTDSGIVFPVGPSKIGGTFKGWSVDGTNVLNESALAELIREGRTHITLRPVYEVSNEKFTVTIMADGASAKTITDVLAGEQITVTAPEISGRQFSYWAADEKGKEILGYSKDYAVLVSGDTTLYAFYQDEGTEIEKRPTVAITDMSAFVEGSTNKVRFVSTYDVPEGYTIQETGMVWSTKEMYDLEESGQDLVIGAEGVNKQTSSLQTEKGSYFLVISVGTSTDTKIFIRGYLTIKNNETGTIETIYSDQAQESFNTLKQ